MVLSLEERVGLVQIYYETGQSAIDTVRGYRNRYGVRDICTATAVTKLIEKFCRTGSVMDAKRTGRPPISEEQVAEVEFASHLIAATNHYAESSTRKIAEATAIPQPTVFKILRKKLNLHPYRIQIVHELKDADPNRRLAFAHRFLAENAVNEMWKYRILHYLAKLTLGIREYGVLKTLIRLFKNRCILRKGLSG